MLQHRLCSAQSSAIKKSNKKIETTRQGGPYDTRGYPSSCKCHRLAYDGSPQYRKDFAEDRLSIVVFFLFFSSSLFRAWINSSASCSL
jgi:hypothetical protein